MAADLAPGVPESPRIFEELRLGASASTLRLGGGPVAAGAIALPIYATLEGVEPPTRRYSLALKDRCSLRESYASPAVAASTIAWPRRLLSIPR